MSQDLQLIPMERSHLAGGLQLSQAARWPHRLEDWEAIFAVSKGMVCVEHGKVVATGFCTLYEDSARFNMIIVDESLRGRGIGKRLFSALMSLAGEKPMTLVATEDGFPLYRKLGFEPCGTIEQIQGTVVSVPKPSGKVAIGTPADMAAVIEQDRAATGIDRARMLESLLSDATVFVAHGGFAALRDFGRGKVVGPIVATDINTARDLLFAAAQGLEGSFLRIDTDPSFGFADTIRSLGLQNVGGGTSMFRGPKPEPHGHTTFALASQALG
jgi:GNAT superfamily N-acetyltransferase